MFRKLLKIFVDLVLVVASRHRFQFGDCPRASVVQTIIASSPAGGRWRAERCVNCLPVVRAGWHLILSALIVAVAASGQMVEIAPFAGGTFGGSIKLQQEDQTDRNIANFSNSAGFGVAGGIRYDADECTNCNVIAFRWMWQNTHLVYKDIPNSNVIRIPLTMNYFMGDFTREFPISDTHDRVRPFVTASLGAVHMSAPAQDSTKFVFGIGGGLTVFPKPRWGFRFQAEYLPIVMHGDVQLVCVGTCVIALDGGLINQVVLSGGPVFRF